VRTERSFGSDPQTVTQTAAAQPGAATTGPRPAAGVPATQKDPTDSGGFGAIDEPPSMMSTPSASVPSFPSMSATGQAIPSPLGEDPAPWPQDAAAARRGSVPEGPFGAVPDLSLVSTTGVSSPGVSDEPGFGHVSDLSLISNQTADAAMDAITQARPLDGPTEAFAAFAKRGATVQLDPGSNPAAPSAPASRPRSPKDEHDSLIDRADLPAVVAKAKPARKAGQLGMTPQGGASAMAGKPPPLVAPQPFGPMEKVAPADESGPHSRAGAMQSQHRPAPGGKAPPSIAKKQGPPNTTPMQARPANPLGTTTPLGHGAQGRQPPPAFAKQPPPSAQRPVQTTEAFGAPVAPPPQPAAPFAPPAPAPPPAAFAPPAPMPPAPAPQQAWQPASPPVQHAAYPSAPPPQQSAYASAPPPMQSHFSAPPPQPQPFSFGSAPPAGPFGSAPPPGPGASQPPIFGSFSSSPPPHAGAMPAEYPPGAFDPNIPAAPAPPQGIQYQTPVLVDVTPRGLVVETAGGYTDTIIPRNSKIPCERTRRFATGRDMQTTVRVRVAQGENPAFPQNTYLGEVELSGLRPAARGEVTVAVTFEVDADGTLRVRARDVQTGQEARATLQLVGVADESSVVMMINRFAEQPVVGSSS
jgi:molecular chaperone DnaK